MSGPRYVSTRGRSPAVDFAEAVRRGLAPDGGLYVPEHHPRSIPGEGGSPESVSPEIGSGPGDADLARARLVQGLVGGTAGDLTAALSSIDAPLAPLVDPGAPGRSGAADDLERGAFLLELFHGPTAAFKDFGAAFLGAALEHAAPPGDRPTLVLVATSGDTGGAVAAALAGRSGIEVAILYPAGRVSDLQERQIAGEPGVRALAVEGSFDDCQRLVKEAFGDPALNGAFHLTSANSINVARLVAQAAYLARAAVQLHARTGRNAAFCVPTGNVGHLVSALWAREAGAPIDALAIATNANRGMVDWLAGEGLVERAALPTLANAMDVALPSNLERLERLAPPGSEARGLLTAHAFDDGEIRALGTRARAALGRALCPHTLCGYGALRAAAPGRGDLAWCVLATAHPAKFPPVGGGPFLPADLPARLREASGREVLRRTVAPVLADVRAALLGRGGR